MRKNSGFAGGMDAAVRTQAPQGLGGVFGKQKLQALKMTRLSFLGQAALIAAVFAASLLLAACASEPEELKLSPEQLVRMDRDYEEGLRFEKLDPKLMGVALNRLRSRYGEKAVEYWWQQRQAEAEQLAAPSSPEDFTVTLNPDGKGVTITAYTGDAVTVVVPREIQGFPVTAIGEDVFAFRDGRTKYRNNPVKMPLHSVALPDTVTALGEGVFRESVIGSLTIPASVKDFGVYDNFGDSPPFKNAAITTFTFTGTRTSISSAERTLVLRGARITNLVLPSGITVIPKHLWGLDIKALRSIAIPDTVTKIEELAFCSSTRDDGYGSGLTSVTIPAGVTEIGDSAFRNNHQLKGVTFLGGGDVKLGQSAFAGCVALSSVTLPKGLTEIPANLFGDSQYKNSTLSTSHYCKSLNSITLPATVKKIGEGAFYKSGLTSLTLSAALVEIGDLAFSGCPLESNITIPDSITRLAFPVTGRLGSGDAFSGCNIPLALQAKLRQLGYTGKF